MECPKCGAESVTRLCPNCGFDFNEENDSNVKTENGAIRKKSSASLMVNTIRVVTVIVGVAISIFGTAILGSGVFLMSGIMVTVIISVVLYLWEKLLESQEQIIALLDELCERECGKGKR